MIKQKVLVNILIWMALSTKDTGKKINNMEKVKNHGLMELCMRVIMFMEKSMVTVNLNGQTVQYMKVNS